MPAAAKAKSADPLLAAVCADPDDDTARLAYADFLEEEGDDARAEFIRVQVELARLPAWDRKAKVLRLRERMLLVRHGEEWRAALPKFAGVGWGRFERGFVSAVAVDDAKVLAKRADAVRAASPVTGVELNSAEGVSARSVKACPWLRSLRAGPGCGYAFPPELLGSRLADHVARLDAGRAVVTNEVATALAAATHLTRLREVVFDHGGISDAGAAALAHAKHLSGLRVLRLRLLNAGGYVTDPHLSSAGVRTLAASPYLTNLTTFDVGNHRFTDDAVRAVLTSPAFAKLETVSFTGSALTPRAFEVAPGPARLRDVDLSQCVIGDAGAAALAKLPQFSQVARLNLRACEVGGKGIAALAKAPLAKTVRELDLADNPVRDAGVDELARGRWPEVHTLNLSTCGIGAESMKALQTADGVGPLLDLDLSHNDVGAAGAIAIARARWSRGLLRLNLARCRCAAGAVLGTSAHLRHLRHLDLTDDPLAPVGVAALLEGEWPELTELRLSGTGAGDEGLRVVARSGLPGRLAVLSLDRCEVTAAGLADLLAGAAPRLVQLDLARNPELGDNAIDVLAKAAVPALRFLSVAGVGLTSGGLERLVGTPLFARLVHLDFHANELSSQIPDELLDANRPPLSPDWAAAGMPLPVS